MLIGTNNVSQGHSAEQVSEGIFTILQYITKHKAHTKVLLLVRLLSICLSVCLSVCVRLKPKSVFQGILPRGHHPCPVRETIQRVNESLRTFSSEFSAIDYHDFTSMFIGEDGTVSCDDTLDYLHLTRQAYMKLCKALHDIVTQMMK